MTLHASSQKFDYVLVGGGLQNGLIALSLLHHRLDCRVALIEAERRLGGNHLWSFHAADVPETARSFVDPLVKHRWGRYEVRFPGLTRVLDEAYASVESSRLHDVVAAAFRDRPESKLLLGTRAVEIGSNFVVVDTGLRLEADLVIDARGPERLSVPPAAGFQKFVGLELEVDAPVDSLHPTIMDAKVPQIDGYRFFYTLPLSSRRVLVEDTYFSDTPRLDVGRVRAEVAYYAMRQGLRPRHVAREESGVLPLPTALGKRPRAASPLVGGYAGGWFHPTTGYSFPAATRLAMHIASRPSGKVFDPAFELLVDEQRRQARFAVMLNRLLFGAFPPDERYHVLERFYRLPAESIRRFYSMTLRASDRARILCGRPPQGLALKRLFSRGTTT